MKQEDKELLLKDLCSRLPYGVKGNCEVDASYDTEFDSIYQTHYFDAELIGINNDIIFVIPLIEDENENTYACEEVRDGIDISDFTPYLRPLSSMTEEELSEYRALCRYHNIAGTIIYEDTYKSFDWLNAHHFDYRGLIKDGLAPEAPEGMYNF